MHRNSVIIIEKLFPLVDSGNSHICITRPRRFGKTVMANMIASFFSKGCDAQDVFENLEISKHEKYSQYRNQYSVIHISFNDISEECTSYKEYIGRIRELLVSDLRREYPDARVCGAGNAIDTLMDIYAGNPNARFIFVLDEWDFIFYPEVNKNADCIILELKIDHTPEEVIQQIKDKKYALKFQGKIGEPTKYTGRILAVGISYDKTQKKHRCKIEDFTINKSIMAGASYEGKETQE